MVVDILRVKSKEEINVYRAKFLHYYSFRETEKYKCSICGKLIIDCEHITGEIYNNIECKRIDDFCNKCIEEQCKHIVGKKYDKVQAVKIVYDIKVVTFDMVEEPEMDFSRVKKIYFERDDIKKITKRYRYFLI